MKVFLNKFSITATTGYGVTTYKHILSGVYFFQDAAHQFIFSNNAETLGSAITGYTDWLNNPQVRSGLSPQKPFLVDTDTTRFGFKGVYSGIPVTLTLHYNLEKFRIGGGFTYEKQFVATLQPIAFTDQVRAYQPNFQSTGYTKLYGLVGYRIYQFWSYDFVAEFQLGKVNAGKQFNKAVLNRELFINFGVSIENNWSEYFRIIIKPSIDFKKYTITLPDGASVIHSTPSFLIQFGLSINIPEIPRSPMPSDHLQLKHVYTDQKTGRLMEVRGQPIWKRQNPKVGENHRRLWRYKRKNKKKLNPY